MKIEISASELRRAADIKEEIEGLQSKVNEILGKEYQRERSGKRRMSAVGRARISKLMKQRWATARKEGKSSL